MTLDLTPSHGVFPTRRIIVVCALIIMLSEIATFEILMVYPAMPAIATHFGTANVAAVVSSVSLAGAVVLPVAGKVADRYGKKRAILVLGTLFILGGIICATTDVYELLILGRILQGGLVGVVSISYALVRDVIPRRYVPIALGSLATGIGMGAVVGPFAAGWLIDGFGFRSVFWFMIIYVGVLLPLNAWLVPESSVRTRSSLDLPGAVLFGVSLTVIIYVIGEGSGWGWTSGTTLGLLGLGVALLVAFAIRELRVSEPLVDIRVLTGAPFVCTVLAFGLISYMMTAHSYMNPILLRAEQVPGNSYGSGLSALDLAVWTAPMGLMGMIVGPLGGYLAKRFGARRILMTSGILYVGVMLTASTLLTVQWQVGLLSGAAGCAVGFLHSSNSNLVQDALPERQGGAGNSVAGMIGMLVSGLSVTITGEIMAAHVRETPSGSPTGVFGDAAYSQAYLVAAVVGVVGLLIALRMKHGREPAKGGLVEDGATEGARDGSDVPVKGPAV